MLQIPCCRSLYSSACAAGILVMTMSVPAPVNAAVSQRRVLNTALVGPGETSVVPSIAGSWSGDELMSAEWLGTLTAPSGGDYVFECAVANAAVLLWIDDHLLCGTPELFRDQEELSRTGQAPSASVTEAPLPPFMRLRADEPHFLRVQLFHNETSSANTSLSVKWGHYNSSLPPEPISPMALSAEISQAQKSRMDMQHMLANGWGTWWRPSALAAVLLPEAAALSVGLCADGTCTDPCATFTPENGHGPEEPCAGGHCDLWSVPGIVAWDRSYWQLNVSLHRSTGEDLNVSLEWFGTGSSGRIEHQTGESVKADEGHEELSLLASVTGGDCADAALTLSADFKFDRAGTVTVGDGAAQLCLDAHGLRTVVARPVTASSVHSSPSACNTTMITLPLSSGFAVSSVHSKSRASSGKCMGHTVFYTVVVALWTGAQAMTTAGGRIPSLSELRSRAATARARAKFSLNPSTSPSNGSVDLASAQTQSLLSGGEAMKAGLMWNVVYHPTQAGPFIEVSPSFVTKPYEIFEWDTYFGALMLSHDQQGSTMGLAVSSLIQVTKAKTLGPHLDGHGFVPGYSKGGRWLAEDRTERPVGAQITLKIWRQLQQNRSANSVVTPPNNTKVTWLLDLLYEDLKDWQQWLWTSRRLPPLLLGGMGSDPCFIPPPLVDDPLARKSQEQQLWCKKSWGMGQLQGARFESLDNSPMYDDPGGGYVWWNASTYRMNLYDVGQSAAIVAECEALAEIAEHLGKADDAALLRRRQKELGDLINAHMWRPELRVYSNVLINGSAYPRVSPTSFYPLLAGIASDEQALATVQTWLTNSSRFCVPQSAAEWPPHSVPAPLVRNKTCYWGVPSISADDPMFLVAGGTSGIYWRGQTWAPQAYLVYKALERYDHIPAIRAAKSGLAAQQLSRINSVWQAYHHICENYASTWDEGGDCTGNHLYSWGGLSAYIALEDQQTSL